MTRAELLEKWNGGWTVLLQALDDLAEGDLERAVSIRGQAMPARDALLRALAHVSYHVGQIVYAAKASRGGGWKYLSIPPGQSEQFNRELGKR